MQGILLIVVFAAVNVAVMVAVFFFLRRWMAKRLPTPVRRQGGRNALVCGVGVLGVWGLLALGIWGIFKQPLRDSFVLGFGVLWVLIFVAFIFGWLHAKSVAGSVLLDCGPHPTKSMFLFNAVIFLLLFGGGGFARLVQEFDSFGIAGVLFGISFSVYWLVMALGRLQIRDNGIWQYWGLLKWDKLQHYQWEGDSLLLQAKTRFPFLGRGALPVPAEHKRSIEEFLRKHCPAASDA